MSTFCSGSAGSGALTQLIATGALDQYLTANSNFTFFKVKYNKHTNFAMESIGQPFNTAVAFGSEAQITLNRSGDLIYFMYVVFDLPAITACPAPSDGASCAGIVGTNQFPAVTDCKACEAADHRVFEQYLDDGYTDANTEEQEVRMSTAKSRYIRDKYGGCVPLECCAAMEGEDCPTHICADAHDGTKPVWAHWVNGIGQFLIRAARIVIGGSTIDTLYNDFLYMWEELTGKSGRRLNEMVGKRYSTTTLVCDSRIRRTLYVPLPFWFTQHSGQALALASLQFHGVQVMIEFERLERCITVSHNDVIVRNCATACCLSPADLSACLETTYIYLDTDERARFATTHYETLITQTQSFQMQTCNSQIRMQLNFNHPVIELIWAVRRQCHEAANNWFNYSGIMNMDPVVSAALYLNNQSRFSSKPGMWFRCVVPYQFHTNIPDGHIYVYSFALYPEDPTPSGSCNMSRIDHVDLALQLQDSLGQEQVTIVVFARNWNVLRCLLAKSLKQQAAESRGSNGTVNRHSAVVPASRHACRAKRPVFGRSSGRMWYGGDSPHLSAISVA